MWRFVCPGCGTTVQTVRAYDFYEGDDLAEERVPLHGSCWEDGGPCPASHWTVYATADGRPNLAGLQRLVRVSRPVRKVLASDRYL